MNWFKKEKVNPYSPTEKEKETIARISGITKSLNASMDNSGILRQGWKTMWTNPMIWRKNAVKSFGRIWKKVGGTDTIMAVKADAFSRENNLNGFYKKANLAVGITEEAYPSAIPEKIPSYSGFLYEQRMNIFDKYIQLAKQTGVELSDKELSSIGQMVNSLTGRGTFGAKIVRIYKRFVEHQKGMDYVRELWDKGYEQYTGKKYKIHFFKRIIKKLKELLWI